MKAVAYSIKPFEKEFLAKANQKKHDITLISNALTAETAGYAEGKDAAIVFTNDDVSAGVLEKLASAGIKYIVTRSVETDHIDKEAAAKYGIKLSNVPSYSPQAIAEHAVAMAFSLNRHLIAADKHCHNLDFSNDGLVGFNFAGKTVGIIGLGTTGQTAARIFSGIGCKVLGYDLSFPEDSPFIQPVTLDELLASSDIISLHLPPSSQNVHLVNYEMVSRMKHNVMLINTSRGAIIDTEDVLTALENGQVGYLGLDVYEPEDDLVFKDHKPDAHTAPLLKKLLEHPNVLITPHQACLTRETLQEIADWTIKNLDMWQQDKCAGDACVCHKSAKPAKDDHLLNG